jgi:L-malate glycosyltransferase
VLDAESPRGGLNYVQTGSESMIEPLVHVMWNMEIGGAERAVYQLVREQRRAGFEADVLLGRGGGMYADRTREAGAVVHELRQRRGLDAMRAWSARAIFRRYRAVHFHSVEPLLILLAGREPGLRRFYTHRGGVRDHGWSKRARYKLVARQLRQFDALSGNTAQSAQVIARQLGLDPNSISVTYNGLDFSLLAPTRPRTDVLRELNLPANGELLIGTAAKLLPLKRIDLLIQAIHLLGDAPVHCLILGDGPARPALERLVADLRLEERVTFAGRKEHVGDYLRVLDIFVLPSGPQEAFGNAVVEAMGIGLPSIVFADGGGLTEHVVDGEAGFVVGSTAELAARLDELIRQPSLRVAIGTAARERVHARYSTSAMLAGYNALYGGGARNPVA